jgi:DNA (cytosine-5)-methyltransferase 1
MEKRTVRVLDIYCGMGGLSLGFTLALEGAEIHGLDLDQRAVDTYNLNLQRFGCRAERANLLTWSTDGEYDILVGGPPCQPWSLANTKNSGEKHPLYPTFQRYFDIVKAAMPAAFVFENVRGLVTQKFKHLLDDQLRSLAETYRVKSAVLNAVDYGVPQKRQRVIVVGIRRDVDVEPVLPQQTHAEHEASLLDGRRLHRWLTVREAIGDLLDAPPVIVHRGHYGGRKTSAVSSDSPSYTVGAMSGGGRGRNIMYLLTDHVMTEKGGSTYGPWDWECRKIGADKPANTITEKHRAGQLVEAPLTPYQEKHPPLDPDKPARAVQSHIAKTSRDMLLPLELPATAILGDPRMSTHEHHYRRNQYYRRLTVRECLRLQSFPDWWAFPENVYTSRRYKLVGEAVPPIFAYRVAVALGKALGTPVKEPPREEDWGLPYFRRAFADYFDGVGGDG